jgi:hypothetical protein
MSVVIHFNDFISQLIQLCHLIYYRESKSTIKKACGSITYEIDDKCMGDLPLLLIVGWKVSFRLPL